MRSGPTLLRRCSNVNCSVIPMILNDSSAIKFPAANFTMRGKRVICNGARGGCVKNVVSAVMASVYMCCWLWR